MALSNAERQRRFKQKIKHGDLARIDTAIPYDDATKLRYLADHWDCSKAAALSRILLEAWDREGQPISGYDKHGEPLPGNHHEPASSTVRRGRTTGRKKSLRSRDRR